MIGIDKWNIQFSSKLDIVKLIIDCTFLAPLLKNDGDSEHLHKLSSELCYCLYIFRGQDFKLGGGAHLKKLRRAEGGAKIFGVFRVKNHDFTPKNHIFSNFRG
jgi:hypothetical protein